MSSRRSTRPRYAQQLALAKRAGRQLRFEVADDQIGQAHVALDDLGTALPSCHGIALADLDRSGLAAGDVLLCLSASGPETIRL
ncbi:hypothetical protein VB636_18595 [Paracoccus sp. APAP_BH8]